MNRLFYSLVFLFIMVNCFFAQSNNQNQNDYSPESWYRLYSKAYNQNDSNDCKTPSELKSEISRIGCGTSAIQLIHMVCNVEVNVQNEPSDGQPDEQITLSNSIIVPKMACGFVVPNLKIFDADCKVDLHFPCVDICENLSPLKTEENTVASIGIYSNNGLLHSLSCGQTVSINLSDIFHKEIEFRVKYSSGNTDQFTYDTKLNPRLSYPENCGLSITPIRVYPNCIGPPPPPVCPPPSGPPSQEDCQILPTYIDTIIATERYDKHLPGNLLYTNFEDYYSYSKESNDAVSEGIGTDRTNTLGAIKANVFVNPNRDKIKRPIIITDGIDFFSNRNGTEILNENITSATLQLLFENDFDLIIADFEGGADFMQKNAFAFIELIKEIQSKDEVDSIEAVVGPSMGGQIIRYALLFWESELISRGEDPYKIKTFVSADSPWLGANASPALQVLANLGKDADLEIAEKLEIMDKLPNSPAARQLLVHHGGENYDPNYYAAPHQFRSNWVQEIEAMEQQVLPLDVGSLVAIADGAINGNSTGLVAPGDPILIYKVDVSLGPFTAQGDLKLFAVKEGGDLIDYLGTWEDQIEKTLNIDDLPILISYVTIDGYDSYPGSPFRLSAYLSGLGINSLEINDDFTFIPTYSALAIPAGENNPTLDLKTANSPVFDDYFADNINSDHNNFLQPGTLDFFMKKVDKQPTNLDACWYAENVLAQNNSALCTQNNSDPSFNIVNDFESGRSSVQSNFTIADLRLLDPNSGDMVLPEVSYNVISTNCKADIEVSPLFDASNNNKLIGFDVEYMQNWDTEFCSLELELCFTNPACPSFEICEQVTVNIRVNGIPHFNATTPKEEQLSNQANVSKSSGIQITNSVDSESMKIFPNPSRGEINIQLGEGHETIYIFRMDGTLFSKQETTIHDSALVYQLEQGTYLIKSFNTKTNTMYTEKVIII